MSDRSPIQFSEVNERQGSFLRRTFLLGGVALAGLGVLGARLAHLQLIDQRRYALAAVANRFNDRLQVAPRGLIVDRNGVMLAGNRPSFSVSVVRDVTQDIDKFHFNKAVARLYELTNALEKFRADGSAGDAQALREALDVLIRLVAPMMPHLGEELWRLLGHDGLLCQQAWPVFDPALALEETVTIAVQVMGKLRGTIECARDLDAKALESAALANDNVQRALGGKPVSKVIVVPNTIVNVVV